MLVPTIKYLNLMGLLETPDVRSSPVQESIGFIFTIETYVLYPPD